MATDPDINLALKLAILASGESQRDLAARLRMHESRLSTIVRGRDPAATPDEQSKIAKALKKSVRELFPTDTERAIA